MMREIAGAIMAAVGGIALLWYILPILRMTYNEVITHVDTSDTTTQQMIDLGDAIFASLGFIVIIVVGFTIFAYATRRAPFDIAE